MDTLLALRAQLDLALADYRDHVATDTPAASAARSEVVKDLQQQIADAIALGAKPCVCGLPAMGMLVTPRFVDRRGLEHPDVYEIGCRVCSYLPDERRAQGFSPEAAVTAWNAR